MNALFRRPIDRRRAALVSCGLLGVLACTARLLLPALVDPAAGGASCYAATQPLAGQWSAPTGLYTFLVGLVFHIALLFGELNNADPPTRDARRTFVFVLSIPAAAVAVSSAVGSYRHGGPSSPLITLTAITVSALLLLATSDLVALARLPAVIVGEACSLVTSASGRASLIVLLLAICGGTGAALRPSWQRLRVEEVARRHFVDSFTATRRLDTPLLQSKDARQVVVAALVDYQCPACRAGATGLRTGLEQFAAKYPGRLRAFSMDFPLDPTCNRLLKAPFHPMSCEAAVAVRVARQAGRDVSQFEAWLFEHQRELTPENIWANARALTGVSATPANRETAMAGVREDVERAIALGVDRTPTIFINGAKLTGVTPTASLRDILELEARRLGLAEPR